MKRPFHSTSPPSSPFSNSEISDEFEPVPKRPRIFISSPTPPPETDDQVHSIDDDEEEEEDEDEIIIDELIIPSVTITEDSQSEDEEDDDDDIIEIEQPNDNTVIIVSDSDFEDNDIEDDDQGIDVTDDILPPSISRLMDASISSTDIDDIEIVQEIQEEFTLMEQEEEEFANNEEDNESLEIVTNDDNNINNNDELIDLTDDEPIPPCSISIPVERKLSIDVQQCPICLETLSDLQCTGVYLTITRCRHVMCTLCSRQLLATSSRCPLCRENVSSTTLMPYCILT